MRTRFLFLAAPCAISLLACGAPAGDDAGGGNRNGNSNGNGMNGSAAGSGSDPFGNSTMMREPTLAGARAMPPVMREEEPGACGATTVAAEEVVIEEEVLVETEVTVQKPVALYIMFDKSLSMDMSNLWEPAVGAMDAFLNDPESNGLRVGLQYFPNGGSCSSGNGYKNPAVAVGELPAHAADLSASLAAEEPDGFGTPIEGALRGVTEFCKQRQIDVPDEQCVSVLVTDGKPQFANGCNENHDALAGIAGAAHTAGVTTFAVGLQGADFNLLDKIAMQGGAPDCDPEGPRYACDVSSGADKLGSALASIRDKVVTVETRTEVQTHVEERQLPCEWQLPEVPAGQTFDRNKVNIKLTAAGSERTFGRVESEAACVEGGWHFDNADAPSRILACPQTCAMLEDLPEAQIDILLGCATVTLVPE